MKTHRAFSVPGGCAVEADRSQPARAGEVCVTERDGPAADPDIGILGAEDRPARDTTLFAVVEHQAVLPAATVETICATATEESDRYRRRFSGCRDWADRSEP